MRKHKTYRAINGIEMILFSHFSNTYYRTLRRLVSAFGEVSPVTISGTRLIYALIRG